jgi:hypothetical protein
MSFAHHLPPNASRFRWWPEIATGLAVFVLMGWHAVQRSTPFIFDDEFGYLATAASLAGRDWSAAAAGMPYYAPLYALFVAPVYLLPLGPVGVYRGALLVNSTFVAIATALLVRVATRRFPGVRPLDAMLCAAVAMSYPAVATYANLAMAESTLMLLVCLLVYLFSRRGGPWTAALIGAIAAAAPITHPRGLVLSIAVVLVAALEWRRGHLGGRRALALLGAIVVIASLGAGLRSLQGHLLYGERPRSEQRLSKTRESLTRLASAEGREKAVLGTVGKGAYLATSTLGLVFLGGAITARRAIRRGAAPDGTSRDGDPAGEFLLLATAGLFALSVVFLIRGSRADHVLYGRYVEIVVPAVILQALLWMYGCPRLRRLGGFLAGGAAAAVLLALLAAIVGRSVSGVHDWISTTGWFVYRSPAWQSDLMTVAIGTTLSLAIGTALLAFRARWFTVWLALMWLASGREVYQQQLRPADRSWAIGSLLRDAGVGADDDVGVFAASWRTGLLRQALQYQLPDSRVVWLRGCGDARLADAEFLAVATDSEPCESWELLADAKRFTLHARGRGGAPPATVLGAAADALATPLQVRVSVREERLTAGRPSQRVAEFLADHFPTAWAEALVASVEAEIEVLAAPAGPHGYSFGAVVMDASGAWRGEWRVALPRALRAGERLSLQVPIELESGGRPRLPPGDYDLHLALVEEGVAWSWEGSAAVPLRVVE